MSIAQSKHGIPTLDKDTRRNVWGWLGYFVWRHYFVPVVTSGSYLRDGNGGLLQAYKPSWPRGLIMQSITASAVN